MPYDTMPSAAMSVRVMQKQGLVSYGMMLASDSERRDAQKQLKPT
jgi:hypothetical protein